MSTGIDLSQLAAPDIIETLDYESILAELHADVVALMPSLAAVLALESEPINVVLQAAAYRELNWRARVNAAARARMLAYATGSDLDHIGAGYNLARLVTAAGDATAVPPVEPTLETDDDFRSRIQASPDAWASAGPASAYRARTLNASGDVLSAVASPHTPSPGDVTVAVLSRSGDGTASAALLATVYAALTDADVRPINDTVFVQSAQILSYPLIAELVLYPGPSSAPVLAAAQAAAVAYTTETHRLGYDVTPAGLYAALRQPGVQDVHITSPVGARVTAGWNQAPYCTGITLTVSATTDV